MANYHVYRAANAREAIKEGVWFISEDPCMFREKAILLHRVKSAANADMVVYYNILINGTPKANQTVIGSSLADAFVVKQIKIVFIY